MEQIGALLAGLGIFLGGLAKLVTATKSKKKKVKDDPQLDQVAGVHPLQYTLTHYG